jgi:hypothetical protein
MNSNFKDELIYYWSLTPCTLEEDERVIPDEKLEATLQSNMFNGEQIKIFGDTLNINTADDKL